MVTVRHRELLLVPLLAGVALSLTTAFLLRFEFAVPASERRLLELGLCIFIPVKGVVFYAFGVHRSWWRLVGVFDLLRLMLANATASVGSALATALIVGPPFPRSIYIIDAALCFLCTAGLQFSIRLYREILIPSANGSDRRKSILVYGAGRAGLTLVEEIRSNPRLGTKILGFLDDDRSKQSGSLAGIPVLGGGRDAARLVMRFKRRNICVSEIVIAMPSATGRQMRTAIANCRATGVPFKTVPGIGELLAGKVLSSQIRDVSVGDLLGREPVRIDESMIGSALGGKSVMVTGGCGSIGSELCRQVARFSPRKLVIFDQAESESFMLALELRNRHPRLSLATEIGDIFRACRVEEAISRHAVEVIFHAAAYKHVPLMEANVIEAVENNVIGTYNVARAAHQAGVQKFILISSDKAVNPTSIMGVTKRIAELIVSAMPLEGGPSASTFASVRFGNVLASAGSVVQIFQRQIASGGPVTVTHPEMRRYFMSIPEAVQLVVQASTMSKASDVFVLDMGEPILITELARNMIRLAGLVPDDDIEIRFTGLRPGEKLFEELSLDGEDILPTFHEKIKIFRSRGPGRAHLVRWLERLQFLLKTRDAREVKAHLLALVPEYQADSPRMNVAAVSGERKVARARA